MGGAVAAVRSAFTPRQKADNRDLQTALRAIGTGDSAAIQQAGDRMRARRRRARPLIAGSPLGVTGEGVQSGQGLGTTLGPPVRRA
tara:strand:- start:8158 stop:8415 length:258 start_codon:yes stop_codon:yes gene_type:complete